MIYFTNPLLHQSCMVSQLKSSVNLMHFIFSFTYQVKSWLTFITATTTWETFPHHNLLSFTHGAWFFLQTALMPVVFSMGAFLAYYLSWFCLPQLFSNKLWLLFFFLYLSSSQMLGSLVIIFCICTIFYLSCLKTKYNCWAVVFIILYCLYISTVIFFIHQRSADWNNKRKYYNKPPKHFK